jgi:hypothetical protein
MLAGSACVTGLIPKAGITSAMSQKEISGIFPPATYTRSNGSEKGVVNSS